MDIYISKQLVTRYATEEPKREKKKRKCENEKHAIKEKKNEQKLQVTVALG